MVGHGVVALSYPPGSQEGIMAALEIRKDRTPTVLRKPA
jgi:hypothetical protein